MFHECEMHDVDDDCQFLLPVLTSLAQEASAVNLKKMNYILQCTEEDHESQWAANQEFD